MPPAFARRTLRRRCPRDWRDRLARAGAAAQVLLFPDTFTNYHEPEIGVAAVELLRRAGCRRRRSGRRGLRCCGRPLISNGLLDQAVANARHNVDVAPRLGRRGWTDRRLRAELHPDDQGRLPRPAARRVRAQAEAVAAACLTFEEFLESVLPRRARRTG